MSGHEKVFTLTCLSGKSPFFLGSFFLIGFLSLLEQTKQKLPNWIDNIFTWLNSSCSLNHRYRWNINTLIYRNLLDFLQRWSVFVDPAASFPSLSCAVLFFSILQQAFLLPVPKNQSKHSTCNSGLMYHVLLTELIISVNQSTINQCTDHTTNQPTKQSIAYRNQSTNHFQPS